MSGQRRIVLYGNSIILGSVGASLQRAPGFEVIWLSAPQPGPAELQALGPDVILFDVENGHPGPAFAVLETLPDLLLLGISPDGNLVRLWSGRQYRELSTTDLTALIEAGSRPHAASYERLTTTQDQARED